MAASSKFDVSSGSPDRLLYASGQRGSYTGASLDRSSSFRENMENAVLSALPSMSRSSSSVTQGDVMNFFQCFRVDLKSLFSEHKFNRQGEFKRLTSVAFGVSLDDSPSVPSKGKLLSPPSPEEFERLKAGVRDSSLKASERVKVFNEILAVINKCLPSITSRKRSRLDVLSGDRFKSLIPTDRSVLGTGIGKTGSQSHVIGSGFEPEQHKSEERTKNTVPNKRTRTSMVDLKTDIRANTPSKPSGNVDRDRELLRVSNSSSVQGEDRTLSISVGGWEKSKMKKKRSVIKPDVAPVVTKLIDGYRETKQGMQQRLVTDVRSRLNDAHSFRLGAVNGAVGVGRADGISQQVGLCMRSSIPKAEQDNNSILHDRRDRPTGLEKERANVRAVNKTNVREDFSSGSPTSSAKLNATARAPRSGLGSMPKMSPVVQLATVANDWELSHCTSKLPVAVGANNRKRTPSTRSSSPPVGHWAGQRPHNSRTARRTNLVSIVSSNDENPTLDTTSDAAGDENGSGFAIRFPGKSPLPVKLKGDHLSSATVSESEESGTAEFRSKERGKKSDETDVKAGQNVQKVSTMVLPPRKNKLVSGEDLGDGVRRQGRTGRGFISTRSLMPMTVEKLGNLGTEKQLRGARLGFEKAESKTGRPPTRKLSDRRAYARQKHTAIHATSDFLVGSDDGHEELLAAANAVINPVHAFSSSFWRQMDPFFGYISDMDISYLNQEGNIGSAAGTPTPLPLNMDSLCAVPNGFGLIEPVTDTSERRSIELSPEHLASGTRIPTDISLYQRLIAAIISEEGNEELCSNGNKDLRFDVCGSGFEVDAVLESDTSDHRSFQSFDLAGDAASNCYRIHASGRSFIEMGQNLPDDGIMTLPGTGTISDLDHFQNSLLSDHVTMPACSNYQYNNMPINERVLLEIQSIGLYREPVTDLAQTGDEEISGDISRFEEKYHEQVFKKKGLLGKLLNSASETKEFQEKVFEGHAFDKLVAMAYEKYMTCWGPNAQGGKSICSKMAKQAALAFLKRTLERCQEFEETGKSCFSEPLFRDIFLSGSSRVNDAQPQDAIAGSESGKPYINTSGCSTELRASAPLGARQSPSLNNHDISSSDALLSVDFPSGQTIGKENTWSNRAKRKELLLDDVGGTVGASSNAPSGFGNSFSSSARGKRSERDREGKGNNREVLSRNGTTKSGRPTSGNKKEERKYKTKPKQKTTQLSASVNGLLAKMSAQPKGIMPSVPKLTDMTTFGSAKDKNEFSLDVLDDPEAIDFSNLQLPEIDVLGGQGQDLGSWLNIDDDGLQDHDFMGLEIPMDDLSDLNMMV